MKKEMEKKTTEVDMLRGPLAKKLLLFTLPIALSSILQQLFNAADTSIVGFPKLLRSEPLKSEAALPMADLCIRQKILC